MTCYHPITLKKKPRYQIVSCGRCYGCRLDYARNWAIRIMHESKYHQQNSFITLTYRDADLVEGISKTTGNIRATLHPPHLRNFWKRFRKEGHDIRYFACGEYGDKLHRPHYHACLFGYDPPDKKPYSSKNGFTIFSSDILDDIWTHGDVRIGALSIESASYVARYMMKKLNGPEAVYYQDEGIHPEFCRMSRRPGIGNKHFQDFKSDIFPTDSVVLKNGQKVRPPRYYSALLENENPELYELIKAQRKEAQSENEDAFNLRRLAVKERIKKAQTTTLKRTME